MCLPEAVEGFGKEIEYPPGITVVGEAEEMAIGCRYVKSLCGGLKVIPGRLRCDESVKIALGILLAPLIGLVNRDRDEIGFELLYNFRIGECRRTVDDAVVSRASQWMSIHGPDEDRFAGPGGQILRLDQ